MAQLYPVPENHTLYAVPFANNLIPINGNSSSSTPNNPAARMLAHHLPSLVNGANSSVQATPGASTAVQPTPWRPGISLSRPTLHETHSMPWKGNYFEWSRDVRGLYALKQKLGRAFTTDDVSSPGTFDAMVKGNFRDDTIQHLSQKRHLFPWTKDLEPLRDIQRILLHIPMRSLAAAGLVDKLEVESLIANQESVSTTAALERWKKEQDLRSSRVKGKQLAGMEKGKVWWGLGYEPEGDLTEEPDAWDIDRWVIDKLDI